MKKNILVFPCGSEIALEIHRAVDKSTHFNLIGASSVDDHGKFIYENYIDGVPFITSDEFYEKVKANNILGRRYFYPLISEFAMYKGLESSSRGNLPVAHKLADSVI